MTDQQILSELETQIGRKLPRIEYEALMKGIKPGHAANEQGRIIGLNLDGLGLNKIPSALLNLENLKGLSLYSNQLATLPPEIAATRCVAFNRSSV